jgi:uncharacterized protein Yka (UPF0111/DUF47 family)
MGKQLEIAAHIERLSFALKTSREKFENALNNGNEFQEIKKILNEIKALERELQVYQRESDEF